MVTPARGTGSDSFELANKNAYKTRAARRQLPTGALGAQVDRPIRGKK
jgi:hypothetical protein